jgi:hypothetical protein
MLQNFTVHFYQLNRTREFYLFLASKIRISPTGIVSSLSLPGVVSPPTDIVTPPRRVTLPFH